MLYHVLNITFNGNIRFSNSTHQQTHFEAIAADDIRNKMCPKVKLLKMSNFSFGDNVFNFIYHNN